MRVQSVPEAVELVPENDQEKELLQKVAQAIPQDARKIHAPVQIDPNGTLVVWKF